MNSMVIENVSELELYINLLKSQNKKNYNNYSELINDLKFEFNIITTKEQLDRVYSPNIDEDIDDLRLIYGKL